MINIKGLNKAKVLAALYNASKPLGLGFFSMTLKICQRKKPLNF